MHQKHSGVSQHNSQQSPGMDTLDVAMAVRSGRTVLSSPCCELIKQPTRANVTCMTTDPNLALLLSEIRSCQLCAPALAHGVRPVLQASENARILVVGQAPGRRVHESGIPFDDPSGDRLRDWMGVDRSTFYNPEKMAILPMGFCYPGTGKSGDLPPRRECEKAWRAPLMSMLTSVQLTIVIGQYAIAWHLPGSGKKSVTETVKNWRDHWPDKLVLPHPSPRNNIWLKKNPWFGDELLPPLQARVQELL